MKPPGPEERAHPDAEELAGKWINEIIINQHKTTMANIDELHWSAILDTEQFDRSIKRIKEEAKRMNMTVSEYLYLNNRAGTVIQQINHFHKEQAANVAETNRHYEKQNSILKQLTPLVGSYLSINGARAFIRELVTITGEFEAQRVALESMLGSKEKADKIFSTLRLQALESPYTLQDLTKYAKQLTAFNVEADQLAETEKRLADVAAGLGVDMGRIVLAYGQVKSAGVLKGTELRQFTEAGVPILQQVADIIEEAEGHAVSLAEVYSRISKKQIPFEMVEEAFKRMTSEGGKFYNMQAELVETIKGKVGKLKDVWQQTIYDLGSEGTINEILKGGLDTITRIVAGLDNMGHVIAEGIALFGTYKAALLVAEAAAAKLTVQETIASVATGSLNKVTKVLNKTLLLNPYAAIAAGATVAVYAIYRAATAQSKLDIQLKNSNKAIADFEAKTSDEVSMLDYLFRNLERAKKGTKEYKAAKDQILNNYGEYLSATDKEALRVGNLADVYDHLKESIIEANRARALEEGSQEINKTYSDTFNAISKAFRENFKERPANRGLMQELGDYLFGRNGVTKGTLSDAAKEYITQVDQAIEAVLNTPGGMFGNGLSTTLTSIDALKKRLEEAEDAANSARDALADGLNLIYGPAKAKPTTPKPTTPDDKSGGEQLRLQERISLLQKYKDTFDKLRQNPLIGDDNARELMRLFYGITDTDFGTQIGRIADELLRLNPELKEYVASIKAGFGKDAADEFQKSLQALESVSKKMEEYLSQDFNIEGEGVAAKISKLLVDLANTEGKIDGGLKDFVAALDKEELAAKLQYILNNKEHFDAIGFSDKGRNVAAENYWRTYRKEAIKAWREQMAREKQAEQKMTAEKVVGYADDLFNQLTGGMDLTAFNDKTINQLRVLRAELLSLTVPDDIAQIIQDPELLERFLDAFYQMRDDGIKKLNSALSEKKVSAAQGLLNAFQGMGAALSDMGEAVDSDLLAGLGQVLSVAEQITSAIAENKSLMDSLFNEGGEAAKQIADSASSLSESSDNIMLFIKIATLMIGLYADAVAKDEQRMEAIRQSYYDLLELSYQLKLNNGVDGPFGKNFVRQIDNARASIDELNKSMDRTIESGTEAAWWYYSSWKKITQGTGKADSIANTMLTEKTGFFGLGKNNFTLAEIAQGRGVELFDAYGNANLELLKIVRDTYKLDDVSRSWIDHLITYTEAYAEAIGVVEDAMADVFGNIAKDAAGSVVDSWITAGDAALDYAEILDDVAQSYAKMILQSAMLDNVFDDDNIKAITEKFINNDYGAAMALIADDMQRIADMEPIFDSIMQAFDPYLNKEGNTLANGIKGITEDTAGLLASYINAIRADVAYLRAMNAAGWNDVGAIKEAVPTLAEYLAQIEANTQNIAYSNLEIARSNEALLNEIQGVISTSSGTRAIKVDVQ